jgi:hypothetical protein
LLKSLSVMAVGSFREGSILPLLGLHCNFPRVNIAP